MQRLPGASSPGQQRSNKEKEPMLYIGAFFAPVVVGTPLVQILITLVVVGVLLWLVNLIPMQSTIKSILNTIVVIVVVLWLLQGFCPFLSRSNLRVGPFTIIMMERQPASYCLASSSAHRA